MTSSRYPLPRRGDHENRRYSGCGSQDWRGYFEPVGGDCSHWMPTNDHYPILACEGGPEAIHNSRLAHRLCNRVDYSKLIGRPYDKDLASVEAARQAWFGLEDASFSGQ